MITDLAARAATAVAGIPADLTGSPIHYAVRAVRSHYHTTSGPRPTFAAIRAAVEDAWERNTGSPYPSAVR